MASVSKGEGNFYVLAMVTSGISIFSAAIISQLIMFGTALTVTLVFSNNKKVDWKLTFIIGPTTFLMAFVGGLIGSKFLVKSKPKNLKLIFAATNLLAAVLMIYNIIYS